MRRWNGWGDDSITYPLPSMAKRYLNKKIGVGLDLPDVTFHQALANVPPSTLKEKNFIKTGVDIRLLHARGQSLPDWIALRSGQVYNYPDGVSYPGSLQDIKKVIAYAKENSIHLIPYGGGTSVVGHINPIQQYSPNLTIRKFGEIFNFDT